MSQLFTKVILHPCYFKVLGSFALGAFMGNSYGKDTIKNAVLKRTLDRDTALMAAIGANYTCINPLELMQAPKYEWK